MDYQKLKTINLQLERDLQKLQIDFDALNIDYSQTKTKFAQNEKRDEEERSNNEKRFNELYTSRNQTNEVLTELSTTVKMLMQNINTQFQQLDKKIDELKNMGLRK